jgi:hypothetical protein
MEKRGSAIDAGWVQTNFQTEPGKGNAESCEKDIQKTAVVGCKVNVKNDKRNVTGAQGVHQIAFDIGREGGCQVVTGHSEFTRSNGKQWFIPNDQYEAMDNNAPVHNGQKSLRSKICDGMICPSGATEHWNTKIKKCMGEEILFKVANGKLQEILGFVVLPVVHHAFY